MNLGEAVKELRKKAGYNQVTFAKRVGVSQTYLSQIEHGHKKPNMSVLESICFELHVPIPVAFWFSVDINDVRQDKKELFRQLKPSIDQMIESLFL